MDKDTIVALATPQGSGGIGIIRLSGNKSKNIAEKITKNPNLKPRYAQLIQFNNDNLQDNAILIYFVAPNSYTGEDVVEFQCHGGRYVTDKVIDLCLNNGARLANPGEFTKRAFENGKISLEQAEGIIDIINAETESEAKAGFSLLNGELFKKVDNMQNLLTSKLAEIEVTLDYPEHDIEYETKESIKKSLLSIKQELEKLINTEQTGRIIKDGINVAILGRPNVGKSSILNKLLGYDRAIVTDVAGTTRDTISESIIYKGIKINLIDTAGIRESQDIVEKIGIDKSIQTIDSADIILLILDNSQDLTKEDKNNIELVKDKNVIFVSNKSDLNKKLNFDNSILVSAKDNKNIDKIKDEIYNKVVDKKIISQDIILTNKRHIQLVKEAYNNINNALENIDTVTLDCIALDIKNAWLNLGAITGQVADEKIIDQIFSRFCLGK